MEIGLNQPIIQKEHGLTSWNSQLWSVWEWYIQQEVYVEMLHAAVEGIRVFPPIPGSRESAWMCGAQNSLIQHVMYVCWSVKHKAIRPWSKHNRSMQTLKEMKRKYSDWISVRKAFRKWGKCKWSHRERWAALSCTELHWAALSWADLRWASLS